MNKKEAIIDLSISFVKQYSFQELSFSYLAEQLSITKAAIHYYFKSKTDLGVAICETIGAHFQEQQAYFEAHPEQSAYLLIEQRLGFLAEDEICPVVSLQADVNKYDATLQAKVRELAQIDYETYARVLARHLSFTQAQELAQVHLASIKGARIYNRTLGIPFEQTVLTKVQQEIREVEHR
jgi:Transcriptional regulator